MGDSNGDSLIEMEDQEDVQDPFLAFIDYARSVISPQEDETEEAESKTGPGWGWIASRILKTCTAYSSGVTAAILLSDLFQAWHEQNKSGMSKKRPELIDQLKKSRRRRRLANTVTIDSIYEKNFLSRNSVLEAVIIDVHVLPGTNIFMLTLGDFWSSNTIDLYLHRKYGYSVMINHNIHIQSRNSVVVLEDMDTSDSEDSVANLEDSDHDREDPDLDDEWKPEHEPDHESEQETVKKLNRKRNFKVGRRRSSVVMRRSYEENSDAPSDDAIKATSSSDVCCTCSKYSSCKTMKCQCRATKGSCGPSCGCSGVKCSNRSTDGKQKNSILDIEALENGEDSQESDEKDKELASRGAMLLQNALAHKPVEDTTNDGERTKRRKPLSDIGNTTGKSNAPRPSQRKKWKKPVIQLVPIPTPTAPAPSQEEANPVNWELETSRKPENSESGESNNIKLKLPRAMRSASSNSSNLLRERNTDQSGADSAGFGQSNSGRASGSDEKENHTRRI